MTLSAGKLRHRLGLWRVEYTKSPMGAVREELVKHSTCWASLDESESIQINEETKISASLDELRFTVRFRRDIKANEYVEFNGLLYKVASVLDPNGRKIELRIQTKGTREIPS
ncbi:TPA: phage head closure protein [Vibrio parahaemolyticus]|nr:phage head closure protein [Vibrio parahaemolyticus]HBH7876306.1 phage head closure protein [Vibrio parahaemolyticus]HCG8518884.1 phage head closure protein [Vibrio parahaemolyticus]